MDYSEILPPLKMCLEAINKVGLLSRLSECSAVQPYQNGWTALILDPKVAR
jgi:hypothetical protein